MVSEFGVPVIAGAALWNDVNGDIRKLRDVMEQFVMRLGGNVVC